MKLQTAIEVLESHQEWRLGKREDMIHEPKQITEALDTIISEAKETPKMDKTFALRFLNFASSVSASDACGEDEKESMISYASKLLKHQIDTATDQDEIDYLDRCNAKEKLKKALLFLKLT